MEKRHRRAPAMLQGLTRLFKCTSDGTMDVCTVPMECKQGCGLTLACFCLSSCVVLYCTVMCVHTCRCWYTATTGCCLNWICTTCCGTSSTSTFLFRLASGRKQMLLGCMQQPASLHGTRWEQDVTCDMRLKFKTSNNMNHNSCHIHLRSLPWRVAFGMRSHEGLLADGMQCLHHSSSSS